MQFSVPALKSHDTTELKLPTQAWPSRAMPSLFCVCLEWAVFVIESNRYVGSASIALGR